MQIFMQNWFLTKLNMVSWCKTKNELDAIFTECLKYYISFLYTSHNFQNILILVEIFKSIWNLPFRYSFSNIILNVVIDNPKSVLNGKENHVFT